MLTKHNYQIGDKEVGSEADTGRSLSNDAENELPRQGKK